MFDQLILNSILLKQIDNNLLNELNIGGKRIVHMEQPDCSA